ncbi:S8 family serine peptidase [Sinomicrobium pectinilyticum]|nr:S8 family serine peptidase [Sinomicrobium pectinilyticum]
MNIFIWKIYCFCLVFWVGGSLIYAQQNQDSIPNNWHLLDWKEDGVYGISIKRAYRELLADKTGDTVLVAVIDTGMDTLHTNLRTVLWRNKREQGDDEDGNGFKGDFSGWNFLGKIEDASLEYKRTYTLLLPKYKGRSPGDIRKRDKREYMLWKEVQQKVMEDSLRNINGMKKTMAQYKAADQKIRETLGKDCYSREDLEKLRDTELAESNLYRELWYGKRFNTNKELLDEEKLRLNKIEETCYYCIYIQNDQQRIELRGADENNFQQQYYGNNNVMDISGHGTHVAGIIGAAWENGLGIKGIADKVQLMAVRILNIRDDELDKDVALAIRYAVDNGARVINMSFAKQYSPHQEKVEKAIRYALKNDVLLVNGAGNNGANIDTVPFYPTSGYLGKNKRFPNMITVGASGPVRKDLIFNVSNYGPEKVDVFAPGTDIYSTDLGGTYKKRSGTSMASPVVAGLAAVLRSYFPQLSARQVKYIIEKSVTPIDFPVAPPYPWRQEVEEVSMKDLCKTGGIVNAYKAIQLAESLTSRKKK